MSKKTFGQEISVGIKKWGKNNRPYFEEVTTTLQVNEGRTSFAFVNADGYNELTVEVSQIVPLGKALNEIVKSPEYKDLLDKSKKDNESPTTNSKDKAEIEALKSQNALLMEKLEQVLSMIPTPTPTKSNVQPIEEPPLTEEVEELEDLFNVTYKPKSKRKSKK